VPSFRKVGGAKHVLTGANDLLPDRMKVTCLPTVEQCRVAVDRLARRLGTDVTRVGGAYSRGGGDATPLALPELLDILVAHLGSDKARGVAA
jgi:hypothetical protein